METRIVVKLSVPGIHAWPGVKETKYAKTQGYLAFPHRHMFHIMCEKTVSHNDRDIEIINLRNQIEEGLMAMYFSSNEGCLMLGAMSCEMLATDLIKIHKLDLCQVLEDNENGAIVEAENFDDFRDTPKQLWQTDNIKKNYERGGSQPSGQKDLPEQGCPFDEDLYQEDAKAGMSQLATEHEGGKNITFICSYLQSGKSTLGAGLFYQINSKLDQAHIHALIEVSDIVKKITKAPTRMGLQGHPELDAEIIEEIWRESHRAKQVIVTGARQVSILKAFPKATLIWMDVPEEIRFSRFQSSDKDLVKSKEGFFAANIRDLDLGIQDVKDYIFNKQRLYHPNKTTE